VDLRRLRSASNTIAIVGVGETDYAADYPASRAGTPTTDHYGFGVRAFKAALDDAGKDADTAKCYSEHQVRRSPLLLLTG
jgi:hypothetical protein